MKTTQKKTAPRKSPGSMGRKEKTILIMAATKAHKLQTDTGITDETFDTWRHRECLDAVGLAGFTACKHADFLPLLAHFQTLSGDDSQAFANLLKSGPKTDHAAPGDTQEARRHLAHLIAEILAVHIRLAETPEADLLALAIDNHYIYQPGCPWEGSTSAASFVRLMARKAAILAKSKGPITVGYLVYLVRQKTRRPDLTLGNDWQAGLADRCTVKQLDQILFTVTNRIAAVEGVGSSASRNKSQRSPRSKSARSPDVVQPRLGSE